MKRALLALLLLASPAAAQQAYSPVGSLHGQSVASLYTMNPPATAKFASVCASGATVYWSTDSSYTPTAGNGQPLTTSGPCLWLPGRQMVTNFRAIGAGATIDVEYFTQ